MRVYKGMSLQSGLTSLSLPNGGRVHVGARRQDSCRVSLVR